MPDQNYEYRFDPFWVSAYPYRVDLSEKPAQQVTITLRNFRDQPQHFLVRLKLPPGITAEPATLEATLEPKSRRGFQVAVRRMWAAPAPGSSSYRWTSRWTASEKASFSISLSETARDRLETTPPDR